MNTLKQIAAVAGMNVKSIPQRLGTSCVIVVGIAGVVAVLVSVLTMAGSLADTVLATGRPDRAIVMTLGADSEIASMFGADQVQTIIDAPGIGLTADGDPAASADMLTAVNLPRKGTGSLAGVAVRGISAESFSVRSEIVLTEGRLFTPGLYELIVGQSVQTEFGGLDIGERVSLRNNPWTVVGVFASGDSFESGMLADVDTLQSAYQRSTVNSVTALLDSPESFDVFKDAITTNPSLELDVVREPEYYAEQSEDLNRLMDFVANVVGSIMTVGALFAALNTMYSAVSTRVVEIATLRAIGFNASGVVIAILMEALLLALVGGASGAAVAWALFSGETISFGGQVGSIVTQLELTPALLGTGIALACFIGFVGGLLPAIRAARLPVAVALRSA